MGISIEVIHNVGEIRTWAIQTLSQIIAEVDKIMLGKEYGVAKWLLDGCSEVTKRDKTITVEEGEILERDTVARLFQVRGYQGRGVPVRPVVSKSKRTTARRRETSPWIR